jgi:hypothetical protein
MVIERDPPDERLAAAIAGLRDNEPDRDLWPGIREQISTRRKPTLQLRWPVAIAAGLVLLLGGAIAGRQLAVREQPDVNVVTGVTEAEPEFITAGFSEAELTLAGAIEDLQRAYLDAAPRLDEDTRRAIASSLAAIDSAIAQARSLAGDSPDDVAAARYLTRTMQRKLKVLQTATSMASRT